MVPKRVVDVRIYKLRAGSAEEFHKLVHEVSIPLVRDWGHDVLSYGPSLTEPDVYFLIRAYGSVAQMQADQEAFYGSDVWKSGPREAIVGMIEHISESVFEMSPEAIDAIRASFKAS